LYQYLRYEGIGIREGWAADVVEVVNEGNDEALWV
jgi:hypothetical protein